MKFGFGAHGWVRSVFRKEVAISGEVPCPKFLIPVVLSQSGLILRVGQIVVLDESGALAALKEIWILPHEDHKTVLSLVSIGSTESTTFQVRLDDLDLSPGLRQDKPQFLRSVLNEGQNSLLIHLCHPSYPVSVRRILRKHQITALIRWNIQQILAGFELSKKFHLGPADFAHDPHIFGLEPSTLFVYEYQVEEYSTHHSLMDILLRPHWDFRSIAANAAFRVVVTLRLWIDSDCHLQGFIHAQQCNREIPPEELEATPWLHRGIFLAQDPSPIPSKDFSAGSNSERARAEQLNWTGDDLDVAPMIAPTFSLESKKSAALARTVVTGGGGWTTTSSSSSSSSSGTSGVEPPSRSVLWSSSSSVRDEVRRRRLRSGAASASLAASASEEEAAGRLRDALLGCREVRCLRFFFFSFLLLLRFFLSFLLFFRRRSASAASSLSEPEDEPEWSGSFEPRASSPLASHWPSSASELGPVAGDRWLERTIMARATGQLRRPTLSNRRSSAGAATVESVERWPTQGCP
eukprot:maker-scaffold116_size340332-snap-gene-2.24 protein:Tk07661 transcript:maker-scaffold116_size340332-snap-gene-2.24-mRNA-1 annotation:"fructose- -bisphosphatase"